MGRNQARKNHGALEGKLLTEVELELMSLLWALGEGSVHDVLAMLPKNRSLAYTSVSTILRILEQKRVVGSRKVGRGHVYFPMVSKSEYEARSVRNMLHKVFDGRPVGMVRQLVEVGNLTEDDLKEIRELLDDKLGGGGKLT